MILPNFLDTHLREKYKKKYKIRNEVQMGSEIRKKYIYEFEAEAVKADILASIEMLYNSSQMLSELG